MTDYYPRVTGNQFRGGANTGQIQVRNIKLASLLVTVVTFMEKIEKIKEKLCGYSGLCFSPQQLYRQVDANSKGYIDVQDIRKFVTSGKVTIRHIEIMFSRMNSNHTEGIGKLTYFGYLKILKPYFKKDLAKDLLMRDTLSYQNSIENHELNQSIIALFAELLMLTCILTAEHEVIKTQVMEEYMLNVLEVSQIIGFGRNKDNLSTVQQFIIDNSDYQVSFADIKYLLAFCDTHQSLLHTQKNLNILFMPEHRNNKQRNNEQQINTQYYKTQQTGNYNYQHYYKSFLGPQNLANPHVRLDHQEPQTSFVPSETQKYCFLHCQHPNKRKTQNIAKVPLVLVPQSLHVPRQQPRFGTNNQKVNIKNSKVCNMLDMDLSAIRKEAELQTPVLENFMNENIIPLNMSYQRKNRSRKADQPSQQNSTFVAVHPNKPYQFVVNEQPSSPYRSRSPNKLYSTSQDKYPCYSQRISLEQSAYRTKSPEYQKNIEVMKKLRPKVETGMNREDYKSHHVSFRRQNVNYQQQQAQPQQYYDKSRQNYSNHSEYDDDGVLAPFLIKPYS